MNMTTCEHCNGIGYTALRNGDDSIDCKVCEGTGKATSTQERMDMDTSNEWPTVEQATEILRSRVRARLGDAGDAILLLWEVERQQAELTALRSQVTALTEELKRSQEKTKIAILSSKYNWDGS